MAKVRISQLAKDLKLSSEALVQMLRDSGENVKSHSSVVDEEIKGSIQAKLDEQRAAIKKKYAATESRVARRRGDRPKAEGEATGEATTEGAPADNTQPQGGAPRDNRGPREGGYQGNRAPREGGQGGGYQGNAPREGGYQGNRGPREGGYVPREGGQGGGYQGNTPREGGYQGNRGPREGGYVPREGGQAGGQGGFNRGPREGGYVPREGGQGGGYQGNAPREGGYQGNRGPREGGYVPREGGQAGGQGGQGGYNRGPREGGYVPREGGQAGGQGGQGGYNRGPREGGYVPREGGQPGGQGGQGGFNRGPREGGYQPREGGQGGYNRGPREGGYVPREGGQAGGQGGQGGFNRGPREGGYQPREGGFQPREGGYQPREGGYQSRSGGQGGGYQGGQGGGYQGGGQGGYQPRSGGQGGYQGGQGGGYQGGGQGGFRNEPRITFENDPNFVKEVAGKQAEAKKAEEHGSHGHGAKKKFDKKKKPGEKDKVVSKEASEMEMKANIKKTLAKIGAGSVKKKYKKDRSEDVDTGEELKELQVSEFISVDEFTKMIGANVSEVIAKCLELGLFVTINQRLDFDTISLLAEEFGFTAVLLDEYAEEEEEEANDDRPVLPRAPVVTVMGHVDHGKTSLLDYIRKATVASGEAGGITQHIASYSVETKNGKVTFLDTPGHEAFAAMRARGSQITDVVVLIVAADSGVMPQTKEAIDHTRAAGVPMVIALNKVDLPTANVDKIKAELSQYNVLVEEYGGTVQCVEISAKTGKGIDELLELLALETEMLELKAPVEGDARGVVIESELDKGRGAIATVLIQKGTLKKGDCFVTGSHSGRVRELFNDRGKKIKEAGPAMPVMVLGLTGTPQAGDTFRVVDNEKIAREIAGKRRLAEKERELRCMNVVTLDNFFETIKAGEIQTLNIIVKGDVDGSVEAVAASLEKLSTEEIKVNVLHKSVGGIKESDIMLAQASKAIVIGFHISPNPKIREHAREAGVDIRTYRIIYEAVDEVKAAMIGMLAPDVKEEVTGQVEIRDVFKVTKIGQIAGCMVTDGKICRDSMVRLIREDVVIIDTTVDTLQRFKDQAKEVATGFECGIMLKGVKEYVVGDRIEVYTKTEVKRKTLER